MVGWLAWSGVEKKPARADDKTGKGALQAWALETHSKAEQYRRAGSSLSRAPESCWEEEQRS